MNTRTASQKVQNNFGAKGWLMIVYNAILYYLIAGLTTDSLNLFPGAFESAYGLKAGILLSYNTPASIIGIAGSFLFAQFVLKWGSRFVASLTLFLSGIIFLFYGHANTLPFYVTIIILFNFMATGFGQVVPNTLMNSWFPKKKGIALGWSTMGMPIATATFVPLAALLLATMGIKMAFSAIGIFLIVLSILTYLLLRNNPEELDYYPDNEPVSKEKMEANLKHEKEFVSQWSIGRLLKHGNMWFMSLGYGCLWMVTAGIISQLVPRLISIGYNPHTAVMLLSAASIVGIIGSYIWGWLDQKYGTRRASQIYAVWYILALISLILNKNNVILTSITVALVGIGIGGIGNLIPSMIGTVYGRDEFKSANRLVVPIASVVRVCAFSIMGIALAMTGGYTGAYLVFVAIAVIGFIMVSLIKTDHQREL